jgi:hypothetical protein
MFCNIEYLILNIVDLILNISILDKKKRLSACLAFLDLVYMQTHANYMQVPLLKKKNPKKPKLKLCVCMFFNLCVKFCMLI